MSIIYFSCYNLFIGRLFSDCMLLSFLGRFFEVLIGIRPEPLWRLLGKIGILYVMEPVLTVIFVINMTTIWEKVMSALRAQIFKRVLLQKVKSLLPNVSAVLLRIVLYSFNCLSGSSIFDPNVSDILRPTLALL